MVWRWTASIGEAPCQGISAWAFAASVCQQCRCMWPMLPPALRRAYDQRRAAARVGASARGASHHVAVRSQLRSNLKAVRDNLTWAIVQRISLREGCAPYCSRPNGKVSQRMTNIRFKRLTTTRDHGLCSACQLDPGRRCFCSGERYPGATQGLQHAIERSLARCSQMPLMSGPSLHLIGRLPKYEAHFSRPEPVASHGRHLIFIKPRMPAAGVGVEVNTNTTSNLSAVRRMRRPSGRCARVYGGPRV